MRSLYLDALLMTAHALDIYYSQLMSEYSDLSANHDKDSNFRNYLHTAYKTRMEIRRVIEIEINGVESAFSITPLQFEAIKNKLAVVTSENVKLPIDVVGKNVNFALSALPGTETVDIPDTPPKSR